MEREGSNQTIIDHFLLMAGEGAAGSKDERLVYFDQKGNCFERKVERGQIDAALRYFDGQPRAIRRSTGGWALAIPTQLVLSESKDVRGETMRIKVTFREFARGPDGIDTRQTVLSSKLVSAEDIRPAFPLRVEGDQRFAVDFGQGPVPVYVIRFVNDRAGRAKALFVDWRDMERATQGKAPFKVQVYAIARDLLRFEPKDTPAGEEAWTQHLHRFSELVETGTEVIPEGLGVSEEILIPTNLTKQDLRRFLARRLKQALAAKVEIPTKTVELPQTLVPFGAWERE